METEHCEAVQAVRGCVLLGYEVVLCCYINTLQTKPYNVHVSVSYPPDTDTPMVREMASLQLPWNALVLGSLRSLL